MITRFDKAVITALLAAGFPQFIKPETTDSENNKETCCTSSLNDNENNLSTDAESGQSEAASSNDEDLDDFEKKLKNLNAEIESDRFSEAESTPLDARRLWNAYMKNTDSVKGGKNLDVKLSCHVTDTSYTALIENVGETVERGYLKLNLDNNTIEVNFGEKFGYEKFELDSKKMELFKDMLGRVATTLEIDGSNIFQCYSFTMNHEADRDILHYNGTVTTVTPDTEKKEKLSRYKDTTLIGVTTFSSLLKSVLSLQHSDAGMLGSEENSYKHNTYYRIIKDAEKYEGAFTFYQNRGAIYLEIKEEDLGKIWCMRSAVSVGSTYPVESGIASGYPTVDPYIFEKQGDEIFIKLARSKYKWSKDAEIAESANQTYKEPIQFRMRIVAEQPSAKKYIVDFKHVLNKLTMSNNIWKYYYKDYFEALVYPEHDIHVENIKSFKENTVIKLSAQYSKGLLHKMAVGTTQKVGDHTEDGKSVPVEFVANFWFRKDSDYRPRHSDPRVGYFTTDVYNLDKVEAKKLREEYISRWNLKKKDPNAKLSEPVKPIVWTIDPSVPLKYRGVIKSAILEWNKAFEKIGYKDAIVVQDAPKDEDYNHADARYNVVRWLTGETGGYAGLGPRMCDPFTGEILSAYFNLDGDVPRFLKGKIDFESNALTGISSIINGRNTDDKKTGNYSKIECCHSPKASNAIKDNLSLASSLIHTMACDSVSKKSLQKEVIRQYLKDVTMHEFGHCLGLRHNFASSNFLSVDELKDESITRKYGNTASVMDYAPLNLYAIQNKKGVFASQTLGTYDYWAIEYGYKDVLANSFKTEGRILHEEVTKKSGLPEYRFMTDEDSYRSLDPYVQTFVLSSDNIKYTEDNLHHFKKARANIMKNFVREGKDFSQQCHYLIRSYIIEFLLASRNISYIGGVERWRAQPGDIGFKFAGKPVDAIEQRRAMKLLVDNFFKRETLDIPKHVAENLNKGYTGDKEGAQEDDRVDDFLWTSDFRTLISNINSHLIKGALLDYWRLFRMVENAPLSKTISGDAYTVKEHVGILTSNIFTELYKGRNVTDIRRDTQLSLLDALLTDYNGIFPDKVTPFFNDVKLCINAEISNVKRSLKQYANNSGNGLNALSLAHYREMLRRIEKAEKRQKIQL